MAGLKKAKKYDWKDSNLALFGSDTEKSVKKSSAMEEKAWKGAGEKVGLRIWRIVKFKVTDWPSEEYGSFYEGDSYIILNTYKKDPNSEELDHDVHFWIGKYSTQDEYGTAAYKTVELDTYLDDKPVQHREVMDYESDRFKSYFKKMSKLKGGAETGFRKVKPTEYSPRLLHVSGDKNKVQIKEVKFKKDYLNDEDVFLIDMGLQIYQWNGDRSSKDERYEGGKYRDSLRSDRGGKPSVEVIDNAMVSAIPEELLEIFSDDGEPGTKRPKDRTDAGASQKVLFRLSDASAQMTFEEVTRGEGVTKSELKSDDVFILDSGKHCFVWIGKGASRAEKQNAFCYAHTYLQNSSHPCLPITVVEEGKESNEFNSSF